MDPQQHPHTPRHFNSLSHAEVDGPNRKSERAFNISTHYLTQRQTRISADCFLPSKYFNSLPHAEVDWALRQAWRLQSNFNSLPHAEVDSTVLRCEDLCTISTHYLTQRQTHVKAMMSAENIISTHYLTQRQTLIAQEYDPEPQFQLTTSRRGRRFYPEALTGYQYFNSLPHAEVDAWTLFTQSNRSYFNSLPHAEVDLSVFSRRWKQHISTHYLTQRQTIFSLNISGGNFISTHYLTQRQTAHTPKTEKDKKISTHYLTQRQTKSNSSSSDMGLFQLTTSRRGRHRDGRVVARNVHFNSLPHAEVDAYFVHFRYVNLISTHYLTQRQTMFPQSSCVPAQYFNSLPHAEVDYGISIRSYA